MFFKNAEKIISCTFLLRNVSFLTNLSNGDIEINELKLKGLSGL
jgi:hypothetical protein